MSRGYDSLRRFTDEHVEDHPLDVDGFELRLRRVGKPRGKPRKAAVLVHGANSGSTTFLVPNGGLSSYLAQKEWDVWLLDWRGSPFVIRKLEQKTIDQREAEAERQKFAFERAADDVAAALVFVRDVIGGESCLSVLGHCVGGGITAVAVATGKVAPSVQNVVLSTLGLFYEVPWDGWIKAEDFILERVLASDPQRRTIDPHGREAWPLDMAHAFQRWPKAWLPAPNGVDHALLNRLTFMVGRPWSPSRIDASIDAPILEEVFGPLHLGLYLHCGQNVRRGFAAKLGEPDVFDRSPLAARTMEVESHLKPEPFRDRKVTLLAAAQNRVWHRDSMELMYEWLKSDARPALVNKCVFPAYGLQELYWGNDAREEVFPTIERALAGLPACR